MKNIKVDKGKRSLSYNVFQPPDQHRFLHINKDMRSLWIAFLCVLVNYRMDLYSICQNISCQI